MRTLSMIDAATRHHLAPDTLKAWHEAGKISAVSVGRRGVSWLFDEATLDREIAALPRCSYRKVDEDRQLTVRCGRPVAEEGAACGRHQAALAVQNESAASRRARIDKGAAKMRKHEDGDFFCEADGCTNKLRVTKGWQIAARRRRLAAQRPDGDTRILCGPCAAERKWREKRPPRKGRWRLCPSCGGGPDWWDPWQEKRFTHCARCFRSAPDVRAKRREARTGYIATPEGHAAHQLVLQSAHAVHGASTATLPREGLVPAKTGAALAAPLLHYSPSTVLHALKAQGKVQRREPNGLARDGVYPNDLLAVEVNGAKLDADARRILGGQLAKVQSVRKGTDFGKPTIDTLRPGTSARIIELHEGGHSYRAIADELAVSKSHVGDVLKAHKSRQSAAVQIP